MKKPHVWVVEAKMFADHYETTLVIRRTKKVATDCRNQMRKTHKNFKFRVAKYVRES